MSLNDSNSFLFQLRHQKSKDSNKLPLFYFFVHFDSLNFILTNVKKLFLKYVWDKWRDREEVLLTCIQKKEFVCFYVAHNFQTVKVTHWGLFHIDNHLQKKKWKVKQRKSREWNLRFKKVFSEKRYRPKPNWKKVSKFTEQVHFRVMQQEFITDKVYENA